MFSIYEGYETPEGRQHRQSSSGELNKAVDKYHLRDGTKKDLDKICRLAVPFVHNIAVNFSDIADQNGLVMEDLMQVTMELLIRIIDKYDPYLHRSFSSFAYSYCHGYLARYVRESGLIRVPMHNHPKYERYVRGEDTGAWREEVKASTIRALDPDNFLPLEKGAEITEDEWEEEAFEEVHESLRRKSLQKSMGKITDRERIVLEYRYGLTGGEEKSLREVGEKLDVSTERVRQIQVGAERVIGQYEHGENIDRIIDETAERHRRARASIRRNGVEKVKRRRRSREEYLASLEHRPPIKKRMRYLNTSRHHPVQEEDLEPNRGPVKSYWRRRKVGD